MLNVVMLSVFAECRGADIQYKGTKYNDTLNNKKKNATNSVTLKNVTLCITLC
jgi:hypothetical protein